MISHKDMKILELQAQIDHEQKRIEALEAALREIVEFPYIGEKAAQQMALIARAALALEQDK